MAVKNSIPSQLHNPVSASVTLTNADGTGWKNLLAVASGDNSQETFLYSITLTNTDTIAHDVLFAIYNGTTSYVEGGITIGAQTGASVAYPPVQLVANRTTPILNRIFKDANGNFFIPVRPGETLQVLVPVAVTGGYVVTATVSGWNFVRS